jgi:hypothetical protein
MKYLKKNWKHLLLVLLLSFFYQCMSSNQPIRGLAKTFTYDVTYQYWISEDEKTKGFDLLIPIKYNPDSIVLDRVYFKRMSTKLTTWKSNDSKTLNYIGRFYTTSKVNKDDSEIAKAYYLKLKDDECLVTFIKDEVKQYKILRHINNMSLTPFYLTRE